MRAASRQTYADALDRLDELDPDTGPAELAAIADELLAVAGLLVAQPALRRALSDPARPGEDRAGLLRGLLGRQVARQTQELLDMLVGGRWSSAGDLLDGCEQLGVQALLASAERAGDAGRGSQLAEVEDELFRFGQVVAGNPALAAAIGDRGVPVARRAGLAEALLTGKATDVTIRAVRVALGGFGDRGVAAALTRLVELAAARRDRSVAYVTVATPLTEAEEQRLGTALSARYGRDVSVMTTVDPQVLGGARVQVGADLYDGTIARRLAEARNALAPR
jgi:F-type H+-transporting ATPase subunit delta